MVNYFLIISMPVWVGLAQLLLLRHPINSSKQMRRIFIIICGIVVFLTFALKHYSVGSGDGGWYYRNWEYISTVPVKGFANMLSIDVEKGYLVCVWLLTRVFSNGQFVFVFYGLLVSVSLCRFLMKNCEDLTVGMEMFLCLGLWGFMVQGIRQGIAMCICLWALEYCKRRKLVRFLLLVFLAVLFHASAVVFIIVYFFPLLKMNVKGYAICVGAVALLYFMIDNLMKIVDLFIDDTYSRGATSDTAGGMVSVLVYLIIIVVAVFLVKGEKDIEQVYSLFFYMTVCGLVTFLMRYSINTIIQRTAYFFMFGQMVILPAAMKRLDYRSRILVKILVIILCIGIATYKATYSNLAPYKFFWQV